MEGVLIEVLQQAKEAGCSASLTFTTSGDKIKANLDIGLEPSLPSSECSTPRSRSTTPSTKSTKRAAAHQASLASQPGASSPPTAQPTAPASGAPQRRPLHLLPSPPDGRRRVMSVGRREMPSVSFLNLDGAHPLPSSPPWMAHPCGLGDCDEFDHCETCFRCQDLCPYHLGCTCRDDVICAICSPDVLEALNKKFNK